MNRLYLFIGGPADGKRVSIPERDNIVAVAGDRDSRGNREKVMYRKECFRFGAGAIPDFETYVFIVEGLSLPDVMARLFDHYPEPVKKPEYLGRSL